VSYPDVPEKVFADCMCSRCEMTGYVVTIARGDWRDYDLCATCLSELLLAVCRERRADDPYNAPRL